jgi:nucleoside-diphosphate-sugar epimerase
MRILIVGGTGLISSELASAVAHAGHDLTLVTRGHSAVAASAGAHTIHADATDASAMRAALRGPRLRGERFDAVVQFVAFDADHVRDDVETFAPLTDHYVLIATSASYTTFDRFHPLTEDTKQENLFWRYAQRKAQAEHALRESATTARLPFTIVRPAHTYGPSKIPAYTGNSAHPWTIVDRMRRGKDIIIPGDGTSLWTITHARDVAAGIAGLLGNADALGAAVHITSDEALTWTGLYGAIASAAGLSAEQFAAQCVFVPSEAMIAAAPGQEGSIRGDKMHPAVYDTSLIKSLVPGWHATVPFSQGVREAIAWHEADAARQSVDQEANAMFDRLGEIYRRALADAGQ